MKRLLIAAVLCFIATGCGTQLKVAQVDEKSGFIKSDVGSIQKATIVKGSKLPINQFKDMAYITGGGDWGVKQLAAINYFNQVVGYDDLQKLVISNGLQEKVPSLNEPIGLNKLYRSYKPFLWVHFKLDHRDNNAYLQLIATNPDTLEDVFISEVKLDYKWAGVNDQNSRYPLFNALIEWINQNR
jgi:hypothetical protein